MTKKPMNKFLKYVLWAGGAFVGLVILLLAAAAIIIPIKYPPEKLKAMATEKLTQTLHHKVTIGEVHFNILSGFKITNLKVANRAGWDPTPLVDAKEISISYDLFPLLWGQVSLGEVELDRPEILIERRGLSAFNFSDMSGDQPVVPAAAPAAKPAPAKAKAAPKSKVKPKPKKKSKGHAVLPAPVQPDPFASFFASPAYAETAAAAKDDKPSKTTLLISVGNAKIVHGRLTYVDRSVSPEQKYLLSDLNLHIKNISMVGGQSTFALSTPLEANKFKYQLSMKGSYRYLMASSLVKDLDLKGMVNDLEFDLAGDTAFGDGFAPKLDGNASLEMLKFAGLVPASMARMPSDLSLTGPANVKFHLGGNSKTALELDGSADGSGLVIAYRDLFAKTNKTVCKVDFKSRIAAGTYELPSYKITYQDWNVTGDFRYGSSFPWSCSVNSKSIPFSGLPGMIPKLKQTKIDGVGSVGLTIHQASGHKLPYLVNGQVGMKGIGVALPNEPYIQNLNGIIYCANNVLRIPTTSFKCFDGDGLAGVTVNGDTEGHTYGLRLTNVDAQKAVNGSLDAYLVMKKDYTTFKNTLAGTMNLVYAGSGKGFAGDAMMKSQVGSGTYNILNAVVKGFPVIKTINGYFGDKSDQIKFAKIEGTLGMKNAIFYYTANTTDKVGTLRVAGAINSDGVYSPDMTVKCDIKREFIDANSIKDKLNALTGGVIPADKVLDYAADANGNVPIDFRFTGAAGKTPGLDCLDLSRAKNNALKKVGDAAGKAVQQGAKDLIKGLFGK